MSWQAILERVIVALSTIALLALTGDNASQLGKARQDVTVEMRRQLKRIEAKLDSLRMDRGQEVDR